MTAQPRHHTDLWGKTYGPGGAEAYPLLGHLLDTAAAARVVCETMIPGPMKEALGEMAGSFESWQAETELIAGWHDLGKASCGFQHKADRYLPADKKVCPSWLQDESGSPIKPPVGVKDHAWWSYLLLWDRLAGCGEKARGRIARGRPAISLHPLPGRRLIPARAGKTRRRGAARRSPTTDPRPCGEDVSAITGTVKFSD